MGITSRKDFSGQKTIRKMNKFISLALLGLIPMIQGQDLWMNSVLDLDIVPPSNWKNSMSFLDQFENGASAGCTMDYKWVTCLGAPIAITSANYPGPMAPEQGCTFNINIPDSLKFEEDGVNKTQISFGCDELQINNVNTKCEFRGLELTTDDGSVLDKYCDNNADGILGGNSTWLDVVGDSLTLTYIPGKSLREGSFSCSLFIPDNYVSSADSNLDSC